MSKSGFTWDFIVVGGGLEGLSLAYHLAKFKARVLLIEKRSVGRPPCCFACINLPPSVYCP